MGISVESARKLARKAYVDLTEGRDLNQEKRSARIKGITLQEVFDDYLNLRGPHLSANTISGYKSVMKNKFTKLLNAPLDSITRTQVLMMHKKLTDQSPTSANDAMRLLRALFNFANGQYEDENGKGAFPDNPVKAISHTRTWNRESRRTRKIDNCDLPNWFKAVEMMRGDALENSTTVSDYLKFALFTGMRRREVSELLWSDVNFKDKSFIRDQTKNGEPLILPLSDYLYELLLERKKYRLNEYIFFGRDGLGSLQEPKKQIKRVVDLCGIEFSSHDLRRTFLSVAESIDINYYTLKRLVNHKTDGDVTSGYITLDLERIRKPMQSITDHLLKLIDGESALLSA